MKFRLTVILTLLGIFGSVAHAQSNCCNIVPGTAQTSGISTVNVPQNANGPGGTYTATITETIVIQCLNTSGGTSVSCNTNPPGPNNVVNATGYGANFNGNFVPCNPIFTPTTVQSTSTTSGTFENVATNYNGVDSNGMCVKANPTSAGSSCPTPAQVAAAACSTSGSGGGTGGVCDACGDPDQQCPRTCTGSPIILDVTGQGFFLTSAANGVKFDISGTGNPIQMGWTATGANNAFLCLPDSNGRCDDGKDLFGNFTPQPPSSTPNGFAALAVYDLPANGGNGDGIIDSRDAVFSSLRLWIDANHDGISQPEELHTLPSLGINSISLAYTLSQRTDQYGNVFRYRATVNPDDPDAARVGRTAYDVFFVTLASNSAKSVPPLRPRPAGAQECTIPVPTKGGMLTTTGTMN